MGENGRVEKTSMKPRSMGLESEFGIALRRDGMWDVDRPGLACLLLTPLRKDAPSPTSQRQTSFFIENGGRLYVDLSVHPEYATPEVCSATDAVRYDKAGVLLTNKLRQICENELRAETGDDSIEVHVLKNNVDAAGNTYGCHENYMVSGTVPIDQLSTWLLPYLATRQIFVGAGNITQTPEGEYYFALAQRSQHITQEVSASSTRNRPILHIRDKPYANAARFRRLHLIVGDSNIGEYPTFLKMGVTSLILRLIETTRFLPKIEKICLENSVQAIQDISKDLTCKQPIRLATGKTTTPLGIQYLFYAACTQFANEYEIPEDERRALTIWGEVLRLIDDNPMKLVGTLDWVTKKTLVDAATARHETSLADPRVRSLDYAYHELHPDWSLARSLEKRGILRSMLDEKDIESATITPPHNTRARLRGRTLSAAKAAGFHAMLDWTTFRLSNLHTSSSEQIFQFDDPLQAHDEELDDFLEKELRASSRLRNDKVRRPGGMQRSPNLIVIHRPRNQPSTHTARPKSNRP